MAEAVEGEKAFKRIGQLKENNYVLIDGEPCKIRSIEKSKPGKHGAAKARITAFGIFDDQKRTLLKPTDADSEVPVIEKAKAQVVAVMGGRLQIMDLATYEIFDVKKPEDLGNLKSGAEIDFIRFGAKVAVVRAKAEE